MTPPLPPPRDRAGPYVVGLVCAGNICRSPTAHVVLAERLRAAGLDDRVRVVSGGTGSWHVGEPMDQRAAAELSAAGYDPSGRAEHADRPWLDGVDLVLAMDARNRADLLRTLPAADHDRLLMFRAADPSGGDDAEVADPWYGGRDGFVEVLDTVERTADAWVAALADHTR